MRRYGIMVLSQLGVIEMDYNTKRRMKVWKRIQAACCELLLVGLEAVVSEGDPELVDFGEALLIAANEIQQRSIHKLGIELQ